MPKKSQSIPDWEDTSPASFSDQVMSESDRQLGHEIQQKYPGMTDAQVAQALVHAKGLDQESIRINPNGVVPGYVPKAQFLETPEVRGVTYNKGAGYPKDAPSHTIVLDPENIGLADDPGAQKFATLDHEIQHVKDYSQHPDFTSNLGPETPSVPHFYGQDTDNRTLPWSGQEALGMMVDRLDSANQAPQGNPPETFDEGGVAGAPSFDDTAPAPAAAAAPVAAQAQPGASAPPPAFDETIDPEQYGSGTEQLKAGVEGVAQGLLGPVATLGEKAIFDNGPEMKARAEANPATHIGGEALGLAGPALMTLGFSTAARLGLEGLSGAAEAVNAASKFTQAGVLEKVAAGGSRLLGLGAEGSGIASKIGSAAVRGAIENAGFQAGDEISKQILDPDLSPQAVDTAIWNTGGAALFGGVVGSAFGAVPALWKARYENQTGGVLHAIVDKVGGIDGVVPDHVGKLIDAVGVDVPPEIRAAMSEDPEIKQLASVLSQSDTTRSGIELQQALKDFKNALDQKMVSSLGRDIREISPDFSEAQAGSKVGTTLADEYAAKMQPISDSFDRAKTLYSDAELGSSLEEKIQQREEIAQRLSTAADEASRGHFDALARGDFGSAQELESLGSALRGQVKELYSFEPALGIKDMLGQDLASLVQKESWSGSDEIMKEVNRVMKRIPELETIGDLQKEMTTVGNNTASKLPYGMQDPLSRAGSLIKSALKDAELTAVAQRIGSEEGVDALNLFNQNRQNFKEVATLRDALNDRLKLGTSPTNYAKGIREMARTDGETLFRRLRGVGDADILKLLHNNFPDSAAELRRSHIDQILADAVKSKRVGDEVINSKKLVTRLFDSKSMSPELRQFILSDRPGADQVIKYADLLAEHTRDITHNYSNTARTIDKLMQHMPGGALGLATWLIGNNPVGALLVAGLTKPLTKDAPDAIRLSLLKFLGANKPVNASAFKSAMELIHSVVKGQNLGMNAAVGAIKNIGQVGSSAVVPIVTKAAKEKLDEAVKGIKENPSKLFKTGESSSYYMPEHGTAIAQRAASVANYLNSIRPEPKQLDPTGKASDPSAGEMAEYDRALGIAEQPLSVFAKIRDGSLMPQDVAHLRAMYPAGYQKMAGNLQEAIADHLSDGGSIPYYTRQAASLFLGSPLDSSMQQQNMLSILLANAPKTRSMPASKQPHMTSKAMENQSKTFATASQSREARRLTQS